MRKEFILRRKRGIGDIISDSFSYFRIHFLSITKTILVIAMPFLLAGAILIGFFYSELFQSIATNPAALPDYKAVNLILGLFLLFVGYLLQQAVVVEYMKVSEKTEKKEITFKAIFAGIKKNVLNYFLGSILIYIIMAAATLAFFLPGIFLLISFSIYFYVISIENKDPGAAIGRSINLIWGSWWKSFLAYFVINLIISAVSYIIIIPFMLIFTVGGLSSSDPYAFMQNMYQLYSLIMPVLIVASSIFMSLMFIAFGMNYYSLVEYREEVGLKQQIEEIESVESEVDVLQK
jgi:hypothetical protein